MLDALYKVILAWPMVVKRGLAHWRLLSAVIVGVLLASTVMAGTIIYFDSLRELALDNTLDKLSTTEKDIILEADRGPTTFEEFAKVERAVLRQLNSRVDWMLRDYMRAGRSATFFLTQPGDEASAGVDDDRAYFAFMPRLLDYITVLPGGRLPQEIALNEPGEPLIIEAIIPAEAAETFGLGLGDSLSTVPYWTDSIPYATAIVSGIFEKNDPNDEIWHLDDTILRSRVSGSFRSVPFFLSESSYMNVLGSAFQDMDSSYAWLLLVDPDRLNAQNASTARIGLAVMNDRLRTDLFSYRQITSLEDALAEYDRRLFFSKLPMFVVLVLIAVVVLYYIVTISSLLVEQQRTEIALLRSRGATSGQILAVFFLEGATISILSIVAAPIIASVVISVLGLTPAFSDLSGGDRLPVDISRSAYAMSALGGLLSFAALMIPAVRASRVGVVRHRQEASRPTSQPFFQRYYLDVLLLAVSILLFRQLSERGSVVATGIFGEVAVDQVLLAVPALILVALGMVLLRLFPLVLNLSSRILSPVLPAGLVMGLWQMARNPTHYARLSLLLILMTGLGIFAASFGGTLDRSFEERALYETGADIRIEGLTLNNRGTSRPLSASYADLPAVEAVSPVFRGFGSDLSKLLGEGYIMFSVDREAIADVAWFRDDFSEEPLDELLLSLGGLGLPEGIAIPAEARDIGVTVKPDRAQSTVWFTARIKDANDRYFTYRLGALSSDQTLRLQAPLRRTSRLSRRAPLQPTHPLTLVSLAVHEVDGRNRLRAGSVSILDVFFTGPDGQRHPLETFEEPSAWSVLRVAPQSTSDSLLRYDGGAGGLTFIWTEGGPLVSRGIFHGPPASPLPVLASRSFLRETGHRIGEVISVSVAGHRVSVRVLDTIDYFPTLDTVNTRYLISDLTSLSSYANVEATSSELKPNEIWISTAGDG
ncbi:MAG: FtsX-like permease family protein, partial [Actinobacteria bacterium]|nr:FtsX-like permease family protein [Actinomycetota bacterium]